MNTIDRTIEGVFITLDKSGYVILAEIPMMSVNEVKDAKGELGSILVSQHADKFLVSANKKFLAEATYPVTISMRVRSKNSQHTFL